MHMNILLSSVSKTVFQLKITLEQSLGFKAILLRLVYLAAFTSFPLFKCKVVLHAAALQVL